MSCLLTLSTDERGQTGVTDRGHRLLGFGCTTPPTTQMYALTSSQQTRLRHTLHPICNLDPTFSLMDSEAMACLPEPLVCTGLVWCMPADILGNELLDLQSHVDGLSLDGGRHRAWLHH